MKAQVISSVWVRRRGRGKPRTHFHRGDVIEVTARELSDNELYLRPFSDAPLPAPNAGAVDGRPTKPDGSPLEVPGGPNQEDGEPAPKTPRTHAEADEQAAELGISFPDGKDKPTVAAKAAAIEQVRAARINAGPGEAAAKVSDERLHELSDEELVQRGIDCGHSEQEMVEMSHDELVTFVAEAINRRTDDPAEQAATSDQE